jgi:hypothetical protein
VRIVEERRGRIVKTKDSPKIIVGNSREILSKFPQMTINRHRSKMPKTISMAMLSSDSCISRRAAQIKEIQIDSKVNTMAHSVP